MTNFKITEKLSQVIQESKLSDEKKKEILSHRVINHVALTEFYQECKPTASMLDLVRMSQLVIADQKSENNTIPKTKEFLESMEHLRLRAKEEEYQKLVKPSSAINTLYEQKFDDTPFDPIRQHKETKNQITTIFNIFISVASVVYAIWYWTGSSWAIRDGYRVLLCLFFGMLILIAEVVVYMGYLRRVEEARVKERSKKEIKKVIRSFTVN